MAGWVRARAAGQSHIRLELHPRKLHCSRLTRCPFLAGTAVGGLIGGCVGDAAAKRWPLRGRIAVTQFSVSIGIPFACLVFKVGGCCR